MEKRQNPKTEKQKFVKDDKFEQQKAKFMEKAKNSKNASLSIHAEFLNEIIDELKIFIDNGVGFNKIAQEVEEVFDRKISAPSLRNYCIKLGIYKTQNKYNRYKQATQKQ